MTEEARIERIAEALELAVQARLKRPPTQSELRHEAKKLLSAYLASRAQQAPRNAELKAASSHSFGAPSEGRHTVDQCSDQGH